MEGLRRAALPFEDKFLLDESGLIASVDGNNERERIPKAVVSIWGHADDEGVAMTKLDPQFLEFLGDDINIFWR